MSESPPLDYMSRVPRRFPWWSILTALACVAILISLLAAAIQQNFRMARNRAYCADSLRGLVHAMTLYAQSNADTFPLVPNTDGNRYINDPGSIGQRAMTTDPNVEINGSYNGGINASNGAASSSPTRCLFILVLYNYIGPYKRCPDDCYVTDPVSIIDTSSRYCGNFTSTSFSYSIAYPWATTSTSAGPGPWWKLNAVASPVDMPVMSDMAPEHGSGTGSEYRNTAALKGAAGTPRIYSSSNHSGKGQNVAYNDSHVEWTTDPYVGQRGDNIWTHGPSNPFGPGGTPVTRGFAETPSSSVEPIDVYMVPVRNVATGGM